MFVFNPFLTNPLGVMFGMGGGGVWISLPPLMIYPQKRYGGVLGSCVLASSFLLKILEFAW